MKPQIKKSRAGRKPKPEAEKRSTRITFRITPNQTETVNRLAAENQMNPSDLFRLFIDRAASYGHQVSI